MVPRGEEAAGTIDAGRGGLDVLSALNGLGGGSTEGVVGGDDHEGEDALGDDVHDGVGHNLLRACAVRTVIVQHSLSFPTRQPLTTDKCCGRVQLVWQNERRIDARNRN